MKSKYCLNVEGQTYWYFLERQAHGGETLQFALPKDVGRSVATRKHMTLFVQTDVLHILVADETKPEHSQVRHTTIARIPLTKIRNLFSDPQNEVGQRLRGLVLKNLLVMHQNELRDYEFVVNLPLTKEALDRFAQSDKRNTTTVELAECLREVRLIRGDRLHQAGPGLVVLVARVPNTSRWFAPFFGVGMSSDETVALCETSLLRELGLLAAKLVAPICSCFEQKLDLLSLFRSIDLFQSYPFAWSDEDMGVLRARART